MHVRILKTRNIAKIMPLFAKFLSNTTTFADSKPNATASPSQVDCRRNLSYLVWSRLRGVAD